MSKSDKPEATETFIKRPESFLIDMDGVLVHERTMVPRADEFLAALERHGIKFLVLTNNSIFTPRDLSARLSQSGLDVPETSIWTSALATARFLAEQRPGGSAFVIGEAGLTTALHEVGYTVSSDDPDYVVLGETRTYSFETIARAVQLISKGARFIATNPDPFMMRSGLRMLGAHSSTTIMIGDRMDTDIVAGLEAGMHTVLVLTGISDRRLIDRYSYLPTYVLDSVADLIPFLDA